jgi:catechol 2,3-dioxygenase-like lactoylglutathione lyase family enzyme
VFDHVTIRVADRRASERFYSAVLGVIGIDESYSGDQFSEWSDFSLTQATAWNPVTRGLHIGFGASSRERVDEFWQVGIDAGYESDGEPGPRSEYGDDYYGGFLLDPDGNSAEAVHFEDVGSGVDHLWVRVTDVEASKRFYETIAPHARIGKGTDVPERVQFLGAEGGSFSVLSGDHVTEHLHMAFSATDDRAVDDFHQAAIEAGYRDNGSPGERPYHRGYYSAYVLDPDGHNVELVNHNR